MYNKKIILLLAMMILLHAVQAQSWQQYKDSARIYEEQQEFKKAAQYYLKASEILKKDSSTTNSYAINCNDLAIVYQTLGEFEKSVLSFMEAKQIWETLFGRENWFYGAVCHNIALEYHMMGELERSESFFIEAKQIYERIKRIENLDYATLCDNLANLYVDLSEYGLAEPLYLLAKGIREALVGKEDIDYAFSCDNLGILYWYMGQFEKAESLLVEANTLAGKLKDKESPYYAYSCNDLALFYEYRNQYEKAEPLLLEARHILETIFGKEHPDYSTNCNNLALNYQHLGQFEKAESFFKESKNIIEKTRGKNHIDYARICNNMANLYKETGQYVKAEPLMLEALQIRIKNLGKDNGVNMETCLDLGNLYRDMGHYVKTKNYFSETVRIQNINLKKIFDFTSEKEKQSYLKASRFVKNCCFSFYTSSWPHSLQGFTYDLSLSDRNIVLSSSAQLRKSIYNSNDSAAQRKYDTWIRLREQISTLSSRSPNDQAIQLKNLEEQANKAEKELTRISEEFKNQKLQKEISWKNIQQSLKPGEAAIEFIEFAYYTGAKWTDSIYYAALLLRKDKPEPALIPLFEWGKLFDLVYGSDNNTNISTLYKRGTDVENNKMVSSAAYHLIWQPLEKHLRGITKIFFAPAGMLHRIAFAALPVDSTHVLSDKYQLVQLATTALVTRQKTSFIKPSDKIYLYGGIQYSADSNLLKHLARPYSPKESFGTSDNSVSRSWPGDLLRSNNFEYLSGTEKEVNKIEAEGKEKKFLVSVFKDIAANEESIKALNGKNSPTVLHIATHGFFFPDPNAGMQDENISQLVAGKFFRQSDNPLFRSGLLFAGANNAWNGSYVEGIEDGILTAYEVSNLYLPNTKLVVLSACETGLGDLQGAEGVYGLQRAFKMAGVKNLVMSLWKVPDAETAEFMQLFYTNLFEGKAIDDAFYKTQAIMKNKYRDDPYKWAAWILVR